MPRKNPAPSIPRTVALCYIRQSFTRDSSDMNSPERQRANCQAVCDRYGWIPEWYQDVDGHKSGTHEKNRPQWLALKSRLEDPDVVALVANDLSRVHRKIWRVGNLLDMLDEYGVRLVLAAPGREIDTSNPLGRMFLNFTAMQDEAYATDASYRQKDSIAHRRTQGKSIGMPPFGTARGTDGYLMPTVRGAWLLPDGHHTAGRADENPPVEGAVWRSYYEAAKRVLNIYAENKHGNEWIADQMNNDGWAFRDRTGAIRPFTKDDIRRLVANWAEYGGVVTDKSGKNRRAKALNPDDVLFKPERAVFDLELLKRVGQVRVERAREYSTQDHGIRHKAYPYPLNNITYCAHCEERANRENNPKLRSPLSGAGHPNKRRYRHKNTSKCGCMNGSVPHDIYEADFARLIKLLTVRPDALNLMTEWAIQADKLRDPGHSNVDLEKEKQEAIALCKRRIEAAVVLFGDGRISREEYTRRIEQNEREIAHWQARTTDTEKAALELAMCMDAVDKLAKMWDMGDDERRQGMARSLFTEVIYNLDTRRIVSFKLKPWADRFLVLRATLYDDDNGSSTIKNTPESDAQGVCTDMPHRGLRGANRIWLEPRAIGRLSPAQTPISYPCAA